MKRIHLLLSSARPLSEHLRAIKRRQQAGNQETRHHHQARKGSEAERIIRERRAQAQSLLVSLGTDAGAFADNALRARTQARIAHALWEVDANAREHFFAKLGCAELADAEGLQRQQEEIRQPERRRAADTPSHHHRQFAGKYCGWRQVAIGFLGEEFLGKLKSKPNSQELSVNGDESTPQRLSLARSYWAGRYGTRAAVC